MKLLIALLISSYSSCDTSAYLRTVSICHFEPALRDFAQHLAFSSLYTPIGCRGIGMGWDSQTFGLEGQLLYQGQYHSTMAGRPLGANNQARITILEFVVPIKHLVLSADQRIEVERLYSSGRTQTLLYDAGNKSLQHEVQTWCGKLSICLTNNCPLESRWSVVWMTSWGSGQGETQQTLYQCVLGMPNGGSLRKSSSGPVRASSTSTGSPNRKIAYPYTGCLSHVEITRRVHCMSVTCISGFWEHNASCLASSLERFPAIPLHPDVFSVALQQLEDGVSITTIQATNEEDFKARICWDARLGPRDIQYHTSLYRQFSRKNGVDLRKSLQYNVDNWLNPSLPNYQSVLADAIFYYRARANGNEHFKVCIAIPAMTEASWEYGHRSQIVLDGTFGVCSSRLLLFIALALDTHFDHQTHPTFNPYIAITDTDTKEHVGKNDKVHAYWREKVITCLQSLEVQLIESVEHAQGLQLIELEKVWLMLLKAIDGTDKVVHGALKHLDYLLTNWMPLALWQSWLQYGRLSASLRLKIPVDGVLPTTNHLESFNALLKRKLLTWWLHSGYRLRFDTLISLLIWKILPSVYAHHFAHKEYTQWLTLQFQQHAGGKDLYQAHKDAIHKRAEQSNSRYCWWANDQHRNDGALAILQQGRLISVTQELGFYRAECLPSGNISSNIIRNYQLVINQNGISTCTCPNFSNQHHACKHLRALRCAISSYTQQGYEHEGFYFPATYEEVEAVLKSLEAHQTSPPQALDFRRLDPAAIQSLGNDPTTIDDGQDKSNNPDIFGDSDQDSSETEGCKENGTGMLPGNSKAALATQISSRLTFEANRILPILHGLSSLLDSSVEFQADVGASSSITEMRTVMLEILAKCSGPAMPTAAQPMLSNIAPLTPTLSGPALSRGRK
ncbi:hypothetical protein FA15DRAFT_731220 [Coprinopsis marcescibilis]|uniref:SWIM-type domain-containing protein n=1 Tax=Coprinopsis marcescibilis TaxID=230819 RepID=A0A5C3KEP6_COPMA|nr:hypothetical protein FA15DRAFT_731220 [Coprinopsis marcescibilis]